MQNLVVVSSTAMSGTHEDRQYIPAMKLMWDEVDARFDPKYVLGEAGHRFCQTYSVRAAHPEFPYALHCLSMMCALVNGARVAVFPTSPSPLTLVAINVNYAQTRIVHDRPRRNPGASVGCCHPEGSGIKIGRRLARAGSARWIARWAFRRASKAGPIHFSSVRCLTFVML